MDMDRNEEFWAALDRLVGESEIVIDRPKGTAHPKFPDFIYKVDYGYLKNTSSMDGGGIDVWVGTDEGKRVGGVMCIVDLLKRDSEIKILIGCTEEEMCIRDRAQGVVCTADRRGLQACGRLQINAVGVQIL